MNGYRHRVVSGLHGNILTQAGRAWLLCGAPCTCVSKAIWAILDSRAGLWTPSAPFYARCTEQCTRKINSWRTFKDKKIYITNENLWQQMFHVTRQRENVRQMLRLRIENMRNCCFVFDLAFLNYYQTTSYILNFNYKF